MSENKNINRDNLIDLDLLTEEETAELLEKSRKHLQECEIWSNKLDALYKQFSAEADPEKRSTLLREIAKVSHKRTELDNADPFLQCYRSSVLATNARVL